MKSLKKIKLSECLNSNELKHLKGGADNNNTKSGCKCTFYDGPSVSDNYNSNQGCNCTCLY